MMDSYVVRIYRRDPKDPRRLVGLVERAEARGEQAFRNSEELMAILTVSKEHAFYQKGKKGKKNSRSGLKGGRR